MAPEERIEARLTGRDTLSPKLADIGDELSDLASEALGTSVALGRAERSADSLEDELDSVTRSASAAAASVVGLDTALSGLDNDIGVDISLNDIDRSKLDSFIGGIGRKVGVDLAVDAPDPDRLTLPDDFDRTVALSVETPQDAHSLVVPAGSTGTKCVSSQSHLYSSIRS